MIGLYPIESQEKKYKIRTNKVTIFSIHLFQVVKKDVNKFVLCTLFFGDYHAQSSV